jgi:hypothetical protein
MPVFRKDHAQSKDEESDFNNRIQDGSAGGRFGKKSQDSKTGIIFLAIRSSCELCCIVGRRAIALRGAVADTLLAAAVSWSSAVERETLSLK